MRIINVMASSLNGRIGGSSLEGDKKRVDSGLSSSEDQEHLKDQISQCDAVIVGASSIRANGRCIAEPKRAGGFPAWYVLSQSPLPLDIEFWRQNDVPRIMCSHQPLPLGPAATGNIATLAARSDDDLIARILEDAQRRHFSRLLLFGGGRINKLFYDRNLVDELWLTLAPLYIRKAQTPELIDPTGGNDVKFRLISSHQRKSYVFLNYEVLKN
ncbi:MAG: dihydrofolate reductase family protein [Oligoflexales bacterium]